MRRVADLAAYANNPRTHSPDQVAQIADETEADHRDPAQWLFFIVPAKQLPQDQKTISRTVVEKGGRRSGSNNSGK